MYLTKLKINNYKCFFKAEGVSLKKGINVIVGKNSSGKTAILEVLEGNAIPNPHLNEFTKPRPQSPIVGTKDSIAEIAIRVPKEELFILTEDLLDNTLNFYNRLTLTEGNKLERSNKSHFCIDDSRSDKPQMSTNNESNKINKRRIKEEIFSFLDKIEIECILPERDVKIIGLYDNFILSSHIDVIVFKNIYNGAGIEDIKIELYEGREKSKEIANTIISQYFNDHIYKFDIHRKINSRGDFSLENELKSNCSNLPTVIDNLNSNPKKLAEYKSLLKSIFTNINDITTLKEEGGVGIKIWTEVSTRPDLAIDLADCGTGIGQVMALLYVIVNASNPRVLLIDEPNSFLHPSASRRLMEIFRKYDHHQYIISTHSTDIIAHAKPDNIILLRLNEKGQTEVEQIDELSQVKMEEILEEVGWRLSDVFGYDKILWVEGETEEKCFPLIVEKLLPDVSTVNKPLRAVDRTGSFDKKQVKKTIDIYKKMVEIEALLPPSQMFLFDSENKSSSEKGKLENFGISFLSRKMYENYVLNSKAIEHLLNSMGKEYLKKTVTTELIDSFWKENYDKPRYWDGKPKTEKELKNWELQIDAAKLLIDTFKEFTKSVEYKKTKHSIELTKWMLENEPKELNELKEILTKFYND